MARQRGIPVIPRAEMLAELMRLKYGIAIAGTHGKTTTTSLVAAVLGAGGLRSRRWSSAAASTASAPTRELGQGEFLVAEADESDGSFLKLSPTIAVVTTVDAEHLDYYADLDAIRAAFTQFVNKVPFYGAAVLCLDEPNIQQMIPAIDKRVITYGLESGADLTARRLAVLRHDARRSRSLHRGRLLGPASLQVPGRHNVLNALAAVAVGLDLEMPFERIQAALAAFAGVQRRFQIRGEAQGVLVVDDYGHHPAEIRATLAAAKAGFDRRVITVFQPHRYTRTLHLRGEFLTAFYQSDVLIVMDIYPAGEAPIPGVHARDLAEGIAAHGHREVLYMDGDRRGHRRVPVRIHQVRRPGADPRGRRRGATGEPSSWPASATAPSSRTGGSRMLGEIRGEVRFKEPLSFHTSLRIGGAADIFVVPQDVEDIRLALSFAEREQLPVEVLGGGQQPARE